MSGQSSVSARAIAGMTVSEFWVNSVGYSARAQTKVTTSGK